MTRACEYRLYEHPVLPSRLVKIGFCWPALIVGPAWLIFRRLWIPIATLLVLAGIAYHLNHHNVSDGMVLNACFYMEDQKQWVSLAGSGITDMDCVTRTENIDFAILVLAQILTAWFANTLWARDLINRGYTLSKSVLARSPDDAQAILLREEESLADHE